MLMRNNLIVYPSDAPRFFFETDDELRRTGDVALA